MIVVMVLLVALLAAGAIAVQLQSSNTRSTGYVRANRTAFYCAEAGLNTARTIIAANYDTWDIALAEGANPAWHPIEGDLDGDSVPDYRVVIRDNDDEPMGVAPNENNDNDNRVFAVSTCVTDPEMPRTVMELLTYAGGGGAYSGQDGLGALGSNNANPTTTP